jgi:hypothetical protein
MQEKLSEKQVFNEIIRGYRIVINDRYQYKNLKEKYQLPNSFDPERVALFRNYFLDNLYPDIEKREELNDAFDSLDNYIKKPEKLLRLIIDSGSLIFKYGRHLPGISKAGIRALKSFVTANRFESKLVEKALEFQLAPPYKKEELDILIKSLSFKEIEEFIDSTKVLFETLNDRVMVKKIIEIVQYLINRMKKHPEVYSAVEIRGLEIGFEIIEQGNILFEQLPKADQEQIFDFVVKIERDVLEVLF